MSRTMKNTGHVTEQSQLLEKIHPSIRHLVRYIVQPGVIDALNGRITISDVTTSRAPSLRRPSQPTGDHVLLNVPYAGHSVSWQVLFDSRFPREAPDIICGDPSFVLNLAKASEKLQLLQTWNADDPECLVKFVEEMNQLYTDFQVSQLPKEPILHQLYDNLCSLGTAPADVEILATPNSRKLRWNLNLSLPQLPLFENWSREQNTASVLFNVTNEKVSSAQLYLNPALEQHLTTEDQSKLPRFSSSVPIANYTSSLKSHLHNTCRRIAANFELRRKLVAALLTVFTRGVIDVDKDTFQSIIMYVAHESLPVIVHIDLSEETGDSIQPVTSLFVPSRRVTFSGKTETFSTEYRCDKVAQTSNISTFCKSFHSGLLKNLTKLNHYSST